MFCIRHAYSLPTRFLSCLFALAVSALFATAAHAQATVSDDAFVNSNTPTANYGSGLALSVGSSSRSFIKFDLSGLPEGIRAEDVRKAVLKLWVNPVGTAGAIDVTRVTSSWSERNVTNATAPTLGTVEASAVAVSNSTKNNFILVDLTELVKGWVSGSVTNHGVAVAAASGSPAALLFDSKENLATSHEPQLQIMLASQGTAGPRGEDGVSVTAIPLAVGDAVCPTGGSKFTAGNGAITYACNGAQGAAGQNGSNGLNGANGQSVTAETLAVGNANCPYGGSKFTSTSGVTYACNGAPGGSGGASGCPAGYVPVGPKLCVEDNDSSGWTFSAAAAHCNAVGGHLPSSAEMRAIMINVVSVGGGVLLDWIDDQVGDDMALYVNNGNDAQNPDGARATTTASFARCVVSLE
jgi:hypothetical protein